MRRHRWVILGLIGLAGLALGCGAAGNGGTDSEAGAAGSDQSEASGDTKAAKIGQAARDGKFEFVVSKVSCGKTKLGGEYFNEKAQGQFCLVTVKVTNIGDEAQMFHDSSQKAFNAKGTEYSTDTGAAIHVNENSETFLNEINPGNSVTGTLVFDIPQSEKLTKLELHDSSFSGGVEVSLTR